MASDVIEFAQVRRFLARPFSMDLRGLALLRIGLGLVVLADLAQRSVMLTAHYTEQGVLPSSLAESPAHSFFWGLGTAGVEALFVVAALAGVSMVLGFHTWLATFVAWVLMTSLQNRNPALFHTGDKVLSLALFWCLFLPLALRASLDERGKPHRQTDRLLRPGTIALVVQMALIFGCAIQFKREGSSWHEGFAVRDALSVSLYTRPLGHWLLQFPRLLTVLTWATELGQAFIPFALLSPFRQPLARTLGVLAILGTQVGFGLCMNLGTFPWVMSVFALALLPPEVFSWLWPSSASTSLALEPGRTPRRSLELACVSVALPLVLLWNFGESGALLVSSTGDRPFNDTSVGRATKWLGLDQRWAMFAPNPQTEDGTFTVVGSRCGEQRALLPELMDTPASDPLKTNQRWLLYFLELEARPESKELLEGLSEYACRVAARTSPVDSVAIEFAHFEHQRDGSSSAVVNTELSRVQCAPVLTACP